MPQPLEIAADEVEAFAQAARQKIDARLKAHGGECPDFWANVASLYARGPFEDEPSEDKPRLEIRTAAVAHPASGEVALGPKCARCAPS